MKFLIGVKHVSYTVYRPRNNPLIEADLHSHMYICFRSLDHDPRALILTKLEYTLGGGRAHYTSYLIKNYKKNYYPLIFCTLLLISNNNLSSKANLLTNITRCS